MYIVLVTHQKTKALVNIYGPYTDWEAANIGKGNIKRQSTATDREYKVIPLSEPV